MASADQLKALLKSHITGDQEHFLSVAMQVAAHEAKQGHGRLAEELRELIDKAKQTSSKHFPKPTLLAQPRGELANLLLASYPKLQLSDMVLEDDVRQKLMRIIDEQRQFTKIQLHGLKPRRKILLVGPPGTGKTMTASVLAGELGIPLFQIRLDGLISKLMGETAAKLRLVFNAVLELRGVYFFDEFDAIAPQRGFTNDIGEARRILNSFLQMIEQDESNSLIIAATNHREILDHAVFRRFDDVIRYGLPDAELITTTLKARLIELPLGRISWKRISELAIGMSFADLMKAADEIAKDCILRDAKSISQSDVVRALEERKAHHI